MAKEDISGITKVPQSDSASHSGRDNPDEDHAEQSIEAEAQTSLDERTSTDSRDPPSNSLSSETSRSISSPLATMTAAATATTSRSSDGHDNERPWIRRQQTREDNDYVQRQTPYSDSAISTYANQRMSEEPFHDLQHSQRSSSSENGEENENH
ncbi:hypothetical protein G7054_g11617 [Neopestalotiopsis clavispora]|nr:hypothetical protein G7054_g11617 [Neopestalotiopsis clavispora]